MISSNSQSLSVRRIRLAVQKMNSLHLNLFIALLALAQCRLFRLKYISNRDVTEIATISLGHQQAFSVVHCTLICINTKGCISTIYRNELCSILRRRHLGQNQPVVENEGAVMSQLDKPCSPNPCLNHGQCIENEFDFKCICPVSTVGLRCENKVLERSCSSIKRKYPAASSGYYNIYLPFDNWNIMTAYCDMETDGGGWMRVLDVRPTSDRIEDFPVFDLQVEDLPNFKSQGNYYLRNSPLYRMRLNTDFTQFRFRCSASTHVLLHIKSDPHHERGQIAMRFLSAHTIAQPPPFCHTFHALPDDNSMVVPECENIMLWRDIQGDDVKPGWRHVWSAGAKNEFICVKKVDKTKFGDFWETYIR